MENEIIIYQPDETIKLDVRFENETVWLTQEQIAKLFGTKRPAITKHLTNIYKTGELDKKSTCSILEHVADKRNRLYGTVYYNLDAILSVGYRVNSYNATLFRCWATKVLKEFLLKGYALLISSMNNMAIWSYPLVQNFTIAFLSSTIRNYSLLALQ